MYFIASFALYFVLAPIMADHERLQDQIESSGLLGISLYVGLYSAQIFIPWLPGAPLDIIGGAVLGFWEATILISITSAFSGLIIYAVVRRIGLERIVAQFPELLESPWRLVKIVNRKPWALVPINMLTGDVAYFVAGAAKVSALTTVLILGAMRVPNVMIGAAIGAGLLSNVLQDQLDVVVAVASVGTVIGLSIGFILARKYLPVWMAKLEENGAAES